MNTKVILNILNLLNELEEKQGEKIKSYIFDENTFKLKIQFESGKRMIRIIKGG